MTTPASADPPAQPPPAPSAAPPEIPETPAELALAQAKKDNRRVEIESMRSESATYYANPDGKTVRMELSTEPIRVRSADGRGFTAIDTTLVAVDGAVRPKAAAGDLALSDGRDKALLKSQAADIGAPSVLPAPKLKGNTATYANAYGQGRDLLVAATPTGFRQKVVIRQRPTGPVSFRVPVDLPGGMSFKKDKNRLTIVGEDGGTVTEVRPTLLQDARAADTGGPLDTGESGRAEVTLADDGATLVFTPDPAFLADPAVTYPVTMTAAADDWWEGHTGQYGGMDTWINDVDYQDSWNTFNQDQIVVGKSYASNVAKRWRGYLKFPNIPATFAGATVDNADLHLWNYLSNACGGSVGTGITARRITSTWDELSLEWGAQPTTTSLGADNEPGAYSPDCTGAMAYEWDLTHSLDVIVQAWVDGETNHGIRLTAGDESELRNWRRYRPEEAGGCRTAPLEDCRGRMHPPILTVDFVMPDPPQRETVVLTSAEPLTSIPEYEEALERSVYLPEIGEVPPAVTAELVAANARRRDGGGSLIGTDLLSPADPGEQTDDTGGNPDGDDTTPPKVLSTTPADGAVDVPLDTAVAATFSEEVGEVEIVLTDPRGAVVEGGFANDATGTVMTFTPARPLKPGTVYTAEIPGAVDAYENAMDTHTWSFTTLKRAAGHWTFDEGEGATAADSSGNGHDAGLTETASWVARENGNAVSNQPSLAQAAAAREAARSREPVEVADATTATSITYAQPDGTFRSEFTAGPVRVRRGEGWVPIDTDLVNQEAVLRPKAPAAGVSVEVSTGGTGPFVAMSTGDGRSYALRWPTPLERPTVRKNTVTFADAAGEGADLVVTVLPTGFRHDVILRQRPAKPLELRIGVETEGMALTEGEGGRLLLSDGKKTVASAPRPVMWDAKEAADREVIATDVVTENGRTELVLKPDHGFLTDPGTTYPVRVDPTVTLPLNDDVDVWSSNTSGFPADPTAGTLVAGRFYGELTRTHLRFATTGLAGATVTDAKLALTNLEAQNCGVQVGPGIQVRRLTAAFNELNLTWGNKPAATTEDAVVNRVGHGTTCPDGVQPMEWAITGIVQDWAAGAANHGLVLMHPNESNLNDNYRVFVSGEDDWGYGPAPTLTVTTAGPASAPAISGPAAAPAQVVNGVTTITSLTPQLSGTVSDPAGGNLTGQFEIDQVWTGTSAAVASGGQATVTIPAGTLTDGQQVRWRARAASATTQSAWSDWQQAVVDVPNPVVSQLQVTPSQQANVTTSLTPALHALVTDPAAQPLRAEFELDRDGQIWAGAANGVASGTQASVTVPEGQLTDGQQVRWRVRAVNPVTTVGSPWSSWQDLTVDLPDPVSAPAVGALQVSPSEQVGGGTVTSTRTPALLVQVLDPAGRPLRAEVELEHDGAQVWAGSADSVPAGGQASILVPAGTLTDGWQVRWRARVVSTTAASEWSDWLGFTVTVPKPGATNLSLVPSKVVDGSTVATTLTPKLTATLTNPTGQPLTAEAEIEHDGVQVWTGTSAAVASGAQAAITVPAGTLTDGWQVRWRLRAVAGPETSPWSDWRQVTVDVTQPGEEPLARTTGPVVDTDESFTVAAWSRWSDKEGDYSLVEQRGGHQSPFRLGNTPGDGLVFTLTSEDTADAETEGVLSGVEPPVDEWFHLAGVYDAAAGTATLYLDGALVGSAPVGFPAWHADGAMTLGSRVVGDLDDVQIYQRPLDASEVAALEPGPAASRAEPVMRASAAAATSGDFDYERVELQDCQVAGKETGYAEYDARIEEKPYNSCWSSYLYLQDYEEDDSTGRKKKSFCKSRIKHFVLREICKAGEEIFDDDYALRFRATWVIHSYLGDATGNAVVDGGGSGVRPTDMKAWFMIDEFAVVDDKGNVVVPGSELSGLSISLELDARTTHFSDGECEVDVPSRTKDITQWRTGPIAAFNVSATVDPSSAFICTLAPHIVFRWNGLPWITIRAWSDKALDSNGKVEGIRRHGKGEPHLLSWVPNFRCDSLKFGAGDPEVPDRFRGCINTRAKRVFVMSKSAPEDTKFIEVILHIEKALNPNNALTNPPLRSGNEWATPAYPPTRIRSGNERNKVIYGNWGAPRYDGDGDDAAGKPLTRGKGEETSEFNRLAFSRRELYNMDVGTPGQEMNWLLPERLTVPPATQQEYEAREKWRVSHARSINYCKYYEGALYPAPKRADKLPMNKKLSCDEYPFASTLEGAGSAKGHYSVKVVNTGQNGLQGTMLKKFWADFRVGHENPFWVLIAP